MNADFAGQQTVGVFAGDPEGSRLDAGFLAGLVVVQGRLEAPALSPAHIHAHEHLGPVLRFGAAGAGMDGDDGVAGVVVARQQGLGFEALDE